MLDAYWSDLIDLQDPLLAIRKKGWEKFQSLGLPKGKQESFQYLKKSFSFPKPVEKKGKVDLCVQNQRLVFVDGFFEESLSSCPSPLIALPLDRALRSYGLFLQSHLAKHLSQEKDPFAALNAAFQSSALFLYLPPNTKTELIFDHFYTQDAFFHPRIHLSFGKGAELTLRQRSFGQQGTVNALFDFVLDSHAKLVFIDESQGTFQAIRGKLKQQSEAKLVLLHSFLRTSVSIELIEEASSVEIYGLHQLKKEEEAHIHSTVEHMAPSTRSKQHCKNTVQDESRYSFEGKIHIHPQAQKSDAYQLSNHLILGEAALSFAKPNLQVFADDVKASHGATVGQLSEEEIFYLQSRGLDRKTAQMWLLQGFAEEILRHAR